MANDLQLLTDSFSKFIVTPINEFGIGGFVFDNEGDTTLNLTAEITDHYTEDNRSVQDHIAIKPKRLTLKGYVGELVYYSPQNDGGFVQKAVQKLTTVSSFLPQLSAAATQATALIQQARDGNLSLDNVSLESVNKILDLWGLAKNLGANDSKQQRAYMYFKALYEQKILSSIQTPYEFLSNMAIESIIAMQDERTKFVSDFTITFKQIRTAGIVNGVASQQGGSGDSDSPTPLPQGRNVEQSQPVTTIGNMPGIDPAVIQRMIITTDERGRPLGGINPNAIAVNAEELSNMQQFGYDILTRAAGGN